MTVLLKSRWRRRCSQLGGVAGRKQPTAPLQPPLPPRRVGAVQHVDDVPGAEAQLVVFFSSEVVERLHPLQDNGGTAVKR